jgi:hypothetical protein
VGNDECSIEHYVSKPSRALTLKHAKKPGFIPADAARMSPDGVASTVQGLGNADLTRIRMPLSVRLLLGSKHLGSVVL